MAALWSLAKKKILIVDDFADMRTMIRSLVVSMGADDIHLSRNGEEAILLMEFNRFDIILCDYSLGEGKDGQQVLEEARIRELLPFTTIFIMVTAENSSYMVFGALEYTPDDYLAKPVTKTTLLTRLRGIMDKKERLHPVLSLMDRRCWTPALKRCEELIESNPNRLSDLLQLKGVLLLELGLFEQSIPFYKSLMTERILTWMTLGLSKALVFSQQYEEAQQVLTGLITETPNLVASYDLLAEAYIQQGLYLPAKDILTKGLAISSKSAVRHSRYARVAYLLEELDAAEAAFKSALRLSKGSCLRSAKVFVELICVLIKKKDLSAAAKYLQDMRREYKDDNEAQAQGTLLEWIIQVVAGKNTPNNPLMEKVITQFKANPELINNDLALFTAGYCYDQYQMDFFRQLARYVVRNTPTNRLVGERVLLLFKNAGIADEGKQLYTTVSKELEDIRQKGAAFWQQDNQEKAIAFMEFVARTIPENMDINLQAANYLLMFMQKNGKTPENLQKARFYLDRVRNINDTNSLYRQLKGNFNLLVANQ